jgi:hypothetical protein
MAKCFVSSQSEDGWRAPLNGLSRNGWNVLGRTFLEGPAQAHIQASNLTEEMCTPAMAWLA